MSKYEKYRVTDEDLSKEKKDLLPDIINKVFPTYYVKDFK